MEVRFRPMPPSALARQVKPGQSPTEDGQSFMEVVESLNASEQTPEQHADEGGSTGESPSHAHAHTSASEPIEEAPEEDSAATAAAAPGDPAPHSPGSDSQTKPVGKRLDFLA